MLDADEFGDAVAMLYEAAAVPEVWPVAIAQLAQIAGCTGGLLFAHSDLGTNWVTSKEFAPVFQRFMEQGWMNQNARMAGLLAHGGTGFITDHDIFSDEEMDRTPMYTDFMRPEGYGWGTATHVRASSGENIVFTLERKFELGPVSRREVEVLDGIRPHLAPSSSPGIEAPVAARAGQSRFIRTSRITGCANRWSRQFHGRQSEFRVLAGAGYHPSP